MSHVHSGVDTLFQHKLHRSTKTAKLYLVKPVLQNSVNSSCSSPPRPRSEDTGETVALVSRAGVDAVSAPLPACLPSLTHSLVVTRSTSHVHARTQHTAEDGSLKQDNTVSALIHGETFVWSANITAKQLKYRVILWFYLTCVASLFLPMLVHVYVERATGR